MTAYNVVRFRVKPGREQDFVSVHQDFRRETMKGLRKGALIKTGDRAYCFVAEWDALSSLIAARPQMIGNLDRIRDLLDDMGGGIGVTDPVSGEAVVEFSS